MNCIIVDDDTIRFNKAVEKAILYHNLHISTSKNPNAAKSLPDCITVKSDRRFVRIKLNDIQYIKGLKDYVIIHSTDKKTITRMTIKGIYEMLPHDQFLRVNKSYIVNTGKVESFDNKDIFIGNTEIAIGPSYRDKVIARLIT